MTILVRRDGSVLLLTIDRPAVRNALNETAMRDLRSRLVEAALDGAVRVVIITGAGKRAFCAGLDLKEVATSGLPDPEVSPVSLLRNGFSKPVIAALNGAAVGGGCELALACDLRVAADHAVLALPEVGAPAATDGGTELPLRLPLAVALEMGLTGDPIPAQRAADLGLLNAVVTADELLDATIALARRIARNSPAAVATTKRLMYESLDRDAAGRRAGAQAATAALINGPDAGEGVAAFLEKRTPDWPSAAGDR